MNNEQFRNLVASATAKSSNASSSSSQHASATPLLGSRARSSIPMTPRSVVGYNSSSDIAKQLSEHKRQLNGQPPTKKFKSSGAPKGTKLAQGYQDRTSLRQTSMHGEQSNDDKEKRLKALEEVLKLQQIDQATFEKLRDEIGVGGDVASTYLVKGLDWKLLEKVKRGEDVDAASTTDGTRREANDVDVEEGLENALGRDVQAVKREEAVKKGEMAPPQVPPLGAQKLSRDEILKSLKASRAAATAEAPRIATEPHLSEHFKKVGSGDKSEKKRFTETVNGRRREVLITTDKDGRTKRKVKWLDEPAKAVDDPTARSQQPLGMEVPAELLAKQRALLEQQQAAELDEDIFEGAGVDYNPLADFSDGTSDDSDTEGDQPTTMIRQERAPQNAKPRSYFGAKASEDSVGASKHQSDDLAIFAAIKRAAQLPSSAPESEKPGPTAESGMQDEQDLEILSRRRQLLETLTRRDREDAGDIDLEFGESRFGDEEDEDAPLWNEGQSKKSARKRGPKRRKGDKDNVNDVMNVLERRGNPAK